VINVIDHGMDVSDAVASPRFHHQWQPDRVVIEQRGLSPDTLSLLAAMGHKEMVPVPGFLGRGIGDANSVMRTKKGIVGVADPRNAGGAVGMP
jgi:gamma-glutamyltranspeptidase/glutathione hydrolase